MGGGIDLVGNNGAVRTLGKLAARKLASQNTVGKEQSEKDDRVPQKAMKLDHGMHAWRICPSLLGRQSLKRSVGFQAANKARGSGWKTPCHFDEGAVSMSGSLSASIV